MSMFDTKSLGLTHPCPITEVHQKKIITLVLHMGIYLVYYKVY
jgi:hypothetical protein